MITFLDVDLENTGGGVMTYWGRVSKNRWFCYCLEKLSFYDDDIDKSLKKYFANEEESEYDSEFDMYDWENDHEIWSYERTYYNGDEDKEEFVERFLEQMFKALMEKYPNAKGLKELRYEEIGY